jgi:hypothetical protein
MQYLQLQRFCHASNMSRSSLERCFVRFSRRNYFLNHSPLQRRHTLTMTASQKQAHNTNRIVFRFGYSTNTHQIDTLRNRNSIRPETIN